MPFMLRCFIGTSFCSLLIIPFMYINAKFVNVLIPILISFGLISLVRFYYYHLRKNTVSTDELLSKVKKFPVFIIVTLAISFMLKDFYPTNYIYNEHDLLYWSWVTNFHSIDYSGSMQSQIAWPMKFTSYHLFPGMFIGYLNYLSPMQNLVGIILLKYIVITLTLSLLVISAFLRGRKKSLPMVVSFAIPFLLFRNEISYNFLISNYLATLIILIILWTMFNLDLNNKNLLIACLFLILSFSKFILFPIGLILFCFFYLRSPSKLSGTCSTLVIIISVLNLYIWLFYPKSKDSASIVLYNPLDSNYFIQTLKYVDWIIDPALNFSTGGLKYLFAGFILAIYISKIFLIFGFLFKKLVGKDIENEDHSDRFYFLIGVLIFMLISLFGYIFIRVDSLGIKHSAHYLYFASVITFVFAGMFIYKLSLSPTKLGLMVVLSLVLAIYSPYKISEDHSLISHSRELNDGSIKISSLNEYDFIKSNTITTHVQLQLQASIKGQKLNCSNDKNDIIKSPIYLFLYHSKGNSC